MENTGLKSKLYTLECAAYKLLNFVFSGTLGFILSKAGIKDIFSPFSLSFLSVCPATGLSHVFMYIGSFLGYITKEFSVHNFKYICSATILLVIILISGKRTYAKSIYSPALPCAICFFSGIIFMFADELSLYNFLLVVCESLLCFCSTYFIKYFTVSLKAKTKMDTKDIISFNITLLILICALDNYYVYGFSISAIFIQVISYISAYYLSKRLALVFTISLCLVISLLHSSNEYYFIYFYIPTLISVFTSKIEKKYIVPTYFIAQATIISMTEFAFYNFNLMLTPIISSIIFYLIPNIKLGNLIANYIDIQPYGSLEENENNSNRLCLSYSESGKELIKKINENKVLPALDNKTKVKLEKSLRMKKCKNIDIANYYNTNGKQILTVTYESKDIISARDIVDKINDISNSNFSVINYSSDGDFHTCKLEQTDIFKVECFALYKAKSGENVCGDNVSAFKCQDSTYAVVLADGMGSGKDAYSKSRDTVNIIKKLLAAAVFPEEAIKTVNTSIEMLKDEIGFSTIDLCNISLKTGFADMYKCGAYTTLILRNKTIIKINGGGLPAGLNDVIHIYKQSVQLYDGDLIIMMSDGVSNAIDFIEAELLLNDCGNIEELTKLLIDCAYRNTPREFDDDMSVIVSKITKKTE